MVNREQKLSESPEQLSSEPATTQLLNHSTISLYYLLLTFAIYYMLFGFERCKAVF
jgi:hypothetical protein